MASTQSSPRSPRSPRSRKWARLGSSRRLLAMRSSQGDSVRSFGASGSGSGAGSGQLFDVVGKTTGQPTTLRTPRSSPRSSPRQIRRTPEQDAARRRSRSPHMRGSPSPGRVQDASPSQARRSGPPSTPRPREPDTAHSHENGGAAAGISELGLLQTSAGDRLGSPGCVQALRCCVCRRPANHACRCLLRHAPRQLGTQRCNACHGGGNVTSVSVWRWVGRR